MRVTSRQCAGRPGDMPLARRGGSQRYWVAVMMPTEDETEADDELGVVHRAECADVVRG